MKKLRALMLAFPLLFIAGWLTNIVAVIRDYDYIAGIHLRANAVQVAIWLALLLPAFFVLDRFLRHSRSRALEAVVIALLCVVCAAAGQLLYGNLAWSQRWFHRGDVPYFLFDERAPTLIRFASRRLETPLLIALAALLIGRFVFAARQDRERELRERRLDARLSEARLRLLRAQLNPHFLFNALNSVMAMVQRDPRAAEEMLDRLSRFYEITATTEGRAWISLGEEIGFARQYLDIEQVRFGARLTVEVLADRNALPACVPALLLQPLVENAVKHGVAKTPGPVWIRLHASREDRVVRVVVENRGTFEPRGNGLGLQNTRERLRQAYGDAFALGIEPERGFTRVVVTIPFALAQEAA